MKYCLVAMLIVLTGCASQHRPAYEAVTDFSPDCRNIDAQIRYLTKLKRFKAIDGTSEKRYNQTIDIQIERLEYYCENEN